MEITNFTFTYSYLQDQLQSALDAGYSFVNCKEYYELKKRNELSQKCIVLRVDIDLSCKKARRLAEIFCSLHIPATFFVRLHAPEYNPFSFENYSCLKFIRDAHFEIGYHSEIIDQSAIWKEDPAVCLQRDLQVLQHMLDIQVYGVASHGGMTGLNNLDFWKEHSPEEYGLLYEAYQESESFSLFKDSFYISDSEWTQWKCYKQGELCTDDRRSLSEHIMEHHPLIYLLIHPDTYFDRHFYEED